MYRTLLALTLSLLLLTAAAYAQEDADEPPPTEPIALRLAAPNFPATFDPLQVRAEADAQIVTNLFTGLTRINPETAQPEPALARNWAISLDGLTWTFSLRDDVPWVAYDAASGAFSAVRPVDAQDVVYSVQRLCSSADAGYYAVQVFGPRIAGCAEGQAAGDGTLAQVSAPDATTVSITLAAPVPYFDALAALWTLYPLPRETVEGFPATWTTPGTLPSSGAFVLTQAAPNDRFTLLANPLLPADLRYGGNVERVDYTRTTDVRAAYRFFEDGLADRAAVPAALQAEITADPQFDGTLLEITDLSVYYIGFMTDLPPFDDVHLRRAFSAVVDRDRFLADVRGGRGLPMIHLTPPDVAYGPPRDLGSSVGFDPDYAREQLALSAYPDCEGLPPVRIVTYSGADGWAGFLVESAAAELGCDETAFQIERLPFADLQAAIDPAAPAESRPNAYTFGWGPDYNDASSFTDLLACGPGNRFLRACSSADELIQTAGTSADPEARAATYQALEAAFFGAEGEFPLIPLFQLTSSVAVKPWLSGPFETDLRFGGTHYDAYTVDAEARGALINCTLTIPAEVNLRGGPGTNFNRVGSLPAGTDVQAIAQQRGTDGFTWWYLESLNWVREDVVEESGNCTALPLAGG